MVATNGKWKGTTLRLSLAGLTWIGLFGVGHAQDVADFYRGKTVDLYVGYSAAK